jgi:1-acyl-sn-glycerol-3-phosphate acyltransferase
MIKAKHHRVVYPLFKLLTRYLLKKNFNQVHIEGDFKDNGTPVLVIANHISWWDGFWMMYLNLKVIHKKFHFMMLEEQLKKHWYFQYSGAYSVKKKSRSSLESIRYTTNLLKDNGNMVFIFPQGRINSMYNGTIQFEKGAQWMLENSNQELQVMLVANFVDYFSCAKPHVFMYTKTLLSQDLKQHSIEHEYNTFYNQVLNQQKTKVS